MKYTLFLICCLACSRLLGQTLTLYNATSQGWAGGMCCSQGVIYELSLRYDGPSVKFQLDTLWIAEKSFVITPNGARQVSVSVDTLHHLIQIHAAESWGRNPDFYLAEDLQDLIEPPKRAPYAGDALIVYRVGGKRHRLLIKELTELPPIAYP